MFIVHFYTVNLWLITFAELYKYITIYYSNQIWTIYGFGYRRAVNLWLFFPSGWRHLPDTPHGQAHREPHLNNRWKSEPVVTLKRALTGKMSCGHRAINRLACHQNNGRHLKSRNAHRNWSSNFIFYHGLFACMCMGSSITFFVLCREFIWKCHEFDRHSNVL